MHRIRFSSVIPSEVSIAGHGRKSRGMFGQWRRRR
jgi:hypothetical protein